MDPEPPLKLKTTRTVKVNVVDTVKKRNIPISVYGSEGGGIEQTLDLLAEQHKLNKRDKEAFLLLFETEYGNDT